MAMIWMHCFAGIYAEFALINHSEKVSLSWSYEEAQLNFMHAYLAEIGV